MFSYKKFQILLEQRKVTSYKVAKETGLYATLFSDWKKGKSTPKADKIKILAEYFDISIEYFLEDR